MSQCTMVKRNIFIRKNSIYWMQTLINTTWLRKLLNLALHRGNIIKLFIFTFEIFSQRISNDHYKHMDQSTVLLLCLQLSHLDRQSFQSWWKVWCFVSVDIRIHWDHNSEIKQWIWEPSTNQIGMMIVLILCK